MNLVAEAIKGTQDALPKESYKWNYIESVTKDVASQFDFKEIRTPVFEKTELFQRGVGDTTDVVQKEMYTFDDKGGRSITLRPEGTAGAMRSVLEHGLFNDALPIKAFYNTTCYRYEKPQAGRLREFHQFGVECIGAASPTADAEVIMLGATVLDRLGIKNISLEINSIGCPECRAKYTEALKEYFSQYTDKLCETCLSRLERNPMRILDCKSPICKEIAKDAPVILDYLCDECKEHFEKVKSYLDAADVEYTINPRIVRGLDYYTKTVFEFITTEIGSQGAVCAGGRYDGLAEELGGPKLPSLGFAMGLERILILMEKQGCEFPPDTVADVYIAPMGDKASAEAIKLCNELRDEGFIAVTDLSGRGLKAQMKYANKIGAKYSIVIGDNELENKKAMLKNMLTGEQKEVSIPDGLTETIYHTSIDDMLSGIEEAAGNL
ncbi:MAG: histidine--tRNA ligase [Acutalibacteraceae bacterium]|nr:histidine--tRNA ligase [Acutalibacteraceae bacterium]